MALEDITDPKAVERAIEEFRAIGQAQFLKKYGFGSSRGWMLVDGGREYDAKAILGAAHGYQHPALGSLPWTEFHGGEATARRLRKMGFTVTEPPKRNPVSSRDELILALDLYMRRRPSFPDDDDPEVIELSQLLNQLAAMTSTTAGASFRNGNGVAMKIQNFRRFDPSQQGKGLSGGGKGEEEVWATFANDPDRLRSVAAAIRAAVSDPNESPDHEPGEGEEGEEAEEGKILTRLHRTRERDRRIVERRKAKALRDQGSLRCETCDFDFFARYGDRGTGFIECHHTRPVSALQPGEKTRLEDLALLCSNCHRMVHVRRPWITVDQLKQVLRPSL